MHKNSFNPKSLIGNWHENRYTDEYDGQHNATSNTYLQNPCKCHLRCNHDNHLKNAELTLFTLFIAYNKYVPVSRAIGNQPNYNKVSASISTPSPSLVLTRFVSPRYYDNRRSLATLLRTG